MFERVVSAKLVSVRSTKLWRDSDLVSSSKTVAAITLVDE